MMTLIEKNISMPYPKKYSKSPSVVHSIRASCENAAMFSCITSQAESLSIVQKKKKIEKNKKNFVSKC